jgi:hypothetical protein
MDNRNPADSFVILPEKCGLNLGATVAQQNGKQPHDFIASESVEISSAAAVSPALYVAAAVMATSAQTDNHQFTVNQLQSKMLSPGAHHAGYLYFQLPVETHGDCVLMVPVQKSGGTTVTFSIPLNMNLE